MLPQEYGQVRLMIGWPQSESLDRDAVMEDRLVYPPRIGAEGIVPAILGELPLAGSPYDRFGSFCDISGPRPDVRKGLGSGH